MEKVFLEILKNSQKNTCTRVSFLIKLQACNFIKKETLAQVFFYELCEISQISQFLLQFQSLIIFEKISILYFWLDCECPSENHLSAISDFTEYVLTLDLKYSLREKYLNAEIFLDRIWTLSTQ